MMKDANDWSGHRATLQHEFGHYADEAIFRRKYVYDFEANDLKNVTVTEDPPQLQAAFAADLKRLKIDDPKNSPSFKLWGHSFKINDFKRVLVNDFEDPKYQKNVDQLYLSVYNVLHGGNLGGVKVAKNDLETRLYVSQTLDAIQSLIGCDYGYGHLVEYVEPRKGTYIETVAQVYSSIVSGYDFLKDLLPNARAIIQKRIK